MPIRSGETAPYAPPETILSLVRTYRSRGLQTPFTPDVLERAGVPSTLVTRVRQSLKLLDLIDDEGQPTTEFEALRRAPESEFQDRLAAHIRSVYAEVFTFVDPAQDGEQRVKDAFRTFEPLGQLGRMVTLFIGLCESAGIVPEGTRKQAGSRTASTRRSPSGPRTTKLQGTARGGAARASGKAVLVNDSIPPALQGLIANLPSADDGWTADQRKKWIAAVTATLDFAIPIRSSEAPENDADDE